MTTGFPKKILGIAIGWSDRGGVDGTYVADGVSNYIVHKFCNTRARIGLEKGVSFKFCSKCMIKID